MVIVRDGTRRPAASDEPPDRPRILLVDRQPLFLAALGRLLSGEPLRAEITTARSWAEAMGIVGELRPQIVLCEMQGGPLPVEQLARQLRQESGAKLVLLGDERDRPGLLAALDSGACGFFTKDCPGDEFIAGVRSVLEGHYVIGPALAQDAFARLARKADGGFPGGSASLSPTERRILALVGQAHSVNAIATSQGISKNTVRNHLASIYRKLQLSGRTEAMLYAVRSGLTSDTG